MSTSPRSTVLGALVIADTASHVLVTCPAGVTYIVKDVRIVNNAASASNVLVFVRRAGPIDGYLFNGSVNTNATADVVAWMVMQPGDQLRAAATVVPITLWVSGTRLTGVAITP